MLGRCSGFSGSSARLDALWLPFSLLVHLCTISFNIGVERVSAQATVRTSDLGVGMGLEFTAMHGRQPATVAEPDR
jgi:hypothetical protein